LKDRGRKAGPGGARGGGDDTNLAGAAPTACVYYLMHRHNGNE